ncbi:DMBT1 protein, partial [Atractosteus spatula]|nr:DMBT1 protein [Atractosteus spatula]
MNRKRAAEPVSGRPAGGERLKARCPTAEWGAALLEGTSGSERAVHLWDGKLSVGVPPPAELACAVERAVKAAVELAMARVTRLVERRCAGLRLRIEDRERELESVRLRLGLAESELRVLRERVGGGGEREPWHAAPQSESRGQAQRGLEAGEPAGRGEFLPVTKKEGDLVNTVAAPSSFPGVTGTLSAKQELYNPPDCEASGEERATDQRQGPTVKHADRTSPRINTLEAHGHCRAGEQGVPALCQALQHFGSSQDTSERLLGADCRPLKQEVSELGYGDVVQESRWPPSPLGVEGSEPGPGQAAGPYSSNAQTGRGIIEGNPRSSRGSISQGRRVRLLGGSDSCSGRVEAYLHGQWGRLCYYDWDIADAQVVCRELGCGSSFSATADFGKGPGLVHPYRAMCTGREPSLHDCSFMRGNIVQCFSDAGVRCTGTGETTPAMPTTQKPISLYDSLKPGIEVYVQYGNSGKYVVVCSSQQYSGEGAVHLEIVSQKTSTLRNPVCSGENMCLFSVDETPPVSFTCVQKTQDSGHGPLTLTSDSQTVSSPGPKHSFPSMSSFSKAYTAFIVIGVTGMIIAIFVTELKARRTGKTVIEVVFF